MSKFKIWVIVLIVCLFPVMVSAHPGRLDKNGCHTCRKNCSKWGLSNGQYHCHGGSSTTNKNTNSNTKKTVKKSNTNKKTTKAVVEKSNVNKSKVVVKSTNADLKSLKINDDSVNISDNMEYKTNLSSVKLYAETSDSKANVEYNSNLELKERNNSVNIKVIAEDTSISKNYVLNIIKLSSNTNIDVYVDGENIDLEDDNIFNTYNDSVDITYQTEDDKASVEIKGSIDDLMIGDNVVKIIVTAEDGTIKEYSIIIKKNDINEFTNINTDDFLNSTYSNNFIRSIYVRIIHFIFNII